MNLKRSENHAISLKYRALIGSNLGVSMQTLMTDQTVSMSDFKRNPNAVLKSANNRPVAVLNHNKPAFYMVQPALFEALLEELGDRDLEALVLTRQSQMAEAIDVDIDTV